MDDNKETKVTEDNTKYYGLGIRHLQIACMTLNLTTLIIARGCMGVAVLAMSDTNRLNSTEVQIFDWDKKTQSVILSSFFWGYFVMQIPAGILAKKFGGKPILLVALLSNTVICLLVPTLAAWGGWMLVCACRASMGLTQACLFSSTHTLLGQWLPANERTTYTGIVYGGVQIGTIVAMPLSGVLAESALGWKLIFYVIAGILFANLSIWYAFGANSPREHRMISIEERKFIESGLNLTDQKLITPWKYIFRSKHTWALLGPNFGFAICFMLFFVEMPTYLEKGLHISLKNSAILSALPYLGMWAGGLFAGFISEKICNNGIMSRTMCRKVVQSMSSFGIALGLVLLSFLGSENVTLIIITLVGCLTMSGFSAAGFLVNQLDLSPNFAGIILCLSNFISIFGMILLPVVTSYILRNDSTDTSRWKIVFLMVSAITAVTNVAFLVFGTAERQKWDDPNFLKKMHGDPEETRPVLERKENKDRKTEET